MPGCGTTGVICVLRQLQEEFVAEKDLYFAFVILQETSQRVPRDVASQASRNELLYADEYGLL